MGLSLRLQVTVAIREALPPQGCLMCNKGSKGPVNDLMFGFCPPQDVCCQSG